MALQFELETLTNGRYPKILETVPPSLSAADPMAFLDLLTRARREVEDEQGQIVVREQVELGVWLGCVCRVL